MSCRLDTSAALLLGAAFLSAQAPPASAQYMYLDANGDGVHTEADVLPATGTIAVEIWLVTDRNRDGTTATCAVDSNATMTINSYEVIVKAVRGTVSWSSFTNLFPTATTSFGFKSDASELYAGFGGGEILPPGTYRLARLEATAVTGAPSLIFGRSTRLFPPGNTSFGCGCMGSDQDNTLKLGLDWFDAAGTLAPTATHTPIVDPVADQFMQEAEARSIAVGAGDADGSMMTLDLAPTLAFARYTESLNEPGRVEGTLSVKPGYADSGSYALTIRANDGVHVGEGAFLLTVLDREPPPVPNYPPELSMLYDLGVPPGGVRDVPVWVGDIDGDSLSLELAGQPDFASLVFWPVKSGRIDGLLHLAPTSADVGSWAFAITASDGVHRVTREVRVTVGPNHPPSLEPFGPVLLMEWRIAYLRVHAIDADQDDISYGLQGAPAFVSWVPSRGWGFLENQIEVTPKGGDAGDYQFEVTASDAYSRVEQPVHLTVLSTGTLPVAWTPTNSGMCVESGANRYLGVTARDVTGTPLTVEVEHAPAWLTSELAGPGALMLTIAPGANDLPAEEYLLLRASNAAGEWGTKLFTLTLRPGGGCYDDCGICLGGVGSKPHAVAGGPYNGYVGESITFDGRWSSEGSAPPGYFWRLGDGSTAFGAVVQHHYAASGRYPAILTVGNRFGTSRDTAEVIVRDPIPARVFVWPSTRVIALTNSKAFIELRAEPLDSDHEAAGLSVGASCLRADGLGEADSIGAAPIQPPALGDRDGNGRSELGVRFSVSDLRRLFASVRGKRDVSARFETRTSDGAPVRGSVTLAVQATPSTELKIGPNPFNPSGTIAFDVETTGLVRVRQFDVLGRLVRTYLDEGMGRPGPRIVTIDGRDGSGRSLASGVYFFKIERGARTDRARVMILK